MSDYQFTKLKIDTTFKNLIPPLSKDEYNQLEENLISEGCRDPICVWNGLIIDGHNRYEICLKNEISFKTKYIHLHSKTEAIAWICANQLGRRNITEAMRKYLIGKRYEAEKVLGNANFEGNNQHSKEKEDVPKIWAHPIVQYEAKRTSKKIGDEYHLSHATVEKYATYSRAIDILAKKNEELRPKILSGQTKISHENVVELSKLPEVEIKRLSKQLVESNRSFVGYAVTRKEIDQHPKKSKVTNHPSSKTTIKNMPAFDPDADISSLTLTIPSWISSIERILSVANLELVSEKAKDDLIKILRNLKKTADIMLINIQEGDE